MIEGIEVINRELTYEVPGKVFEKVFVLFYRALDLVRFRDVCYGGTREDLSQRQVSVYNVANKRLVKAFVDYLLILPIQGGVLFIHFNRG